MPLNPQHQHFEGYWRIQMTEAQRAYLSACDQHQRMVEEMIQNGIPFQDGSFAITKARRAESAALSEYRRVFGIYKKVVSGEDGPPPDREEKP